MYGLVLVLAPSYHVELGIALVKDLGNKPQVCHRTKCSRSIVHVPRAQVAIPRVVWDVWEQATQKALGATTSQRGLANLRLNLRLPLQKSRLLCPSFEAQCPRVDDLAAVEEDPKVYWHPWISTRFPLPLTSVHHEYSCASPLDDRNR